MHVLSKVLEKSVIGIEMNRSAVLAHNCYQDAYNGILVLPGFSCLGAATEKLKEHWGYFLYFCQ